MAKRTLVLLLTGSDPGAPPGHISSGHRINDRAIDPIGKVNGKTSFSEEIEVSRMAKFLS